MSGDPAREEMALSKKHNRKAAGAAPKGNAKARLLAKLTAMRAQVAAEEGGADEKEDGAS